MILKYVKSVCHIWLAHVVLVWNASFGSALGPMAGSVLTLDHHKGRAGDEIMRFEQAIDRGLRHEVVLLVGKAHRQFSRRQFRLFQRHLDDPAPDVGLNAVPNPVRS
jgi:hypothetical protein